MNSKVIIAALVGAVFYFLLGWLIFGILLSGSMEDGMSDAMRGVYRGMDEFIYWAIAISNLCMALLLALIYNRFGLSTFMKGAVNGLWIGALMTLMYDFGMYAQFTMFELDMVFMDAVMSAIMTALVGGVVAFMLGRGKKSAVA